MAVNGEQIVTDQSWFHPALEDVARAAQKRSPGDARVRAHPCDTVVVDSLRIRLAARVRQTNGKALDIGDSNLWPRRQSGQGSHGGAHCCRQEISSRHLFSIAPQALVRYQKS
jgi:hypothetical protein